MKNVTTQNIVITGASSGIGRALAFEYAAKGARLVLLSRNIEALAAMAEEIQAKGGEIYCVRCDVSDREHMQAGIAFAHESLGRIDVAILNAGIGGPEWMIHFRSDEFKEVISTNTFGIAYGLECLIPLMSEQSGGVIVGVSSISDIRGFPGSASYSASKAATTKLLESARVELRRVGIKVITVRPGFVVSSMTAKNEFYMPFLMKTQKAAKIIVRGIEKKKSIIQFPLRLVLISRLIRILPPWLFDRLARMGREEEK